MNAIISYRYKKLSPKVKVDSNNRIYEKFKLNYKRYRLFNSPKINSEIYPKSYPIFKPLEMGNLSAAEVYQFLMSELTLKKLKSILSQKTLIP